MVLGNCGGTEMKGIRARLLAKFKRRYEAAKTKSADRCVPYHVTGNGVMYTNASEVLGSAVVRKQLKSVAALQSILTRKEVA